MPLTVSDFWAAEPPEVAALVELPSVFPDGDDPSLPESAEPSPLLSLDSIEGRSSPDDEDESDPQAEKEIKHPKKTPKNPILSKFLSVMG